MLKRVLSLLFIFGGLYCVSLIAAPPNAMDTDLKTLEENFTTTIEKADRDYQKVLGQAVERRIEGYRAALKTATKAGDFDRATTIKARIVELESVSPGERAVRPKTTVVFGAHRYAVIREGTSWHVAKRKCEEMGGHLACIESPQEAAFISRISGGNATWVGATDDESEGRWKWINGAPFRNFFGGFADNASGAEHHLSWSGQRWNDVGADFRYHYCCEWE